MIGRWTWAIEMFGTGKMKETIVWRPVAWIWRWTWSALAWVLSKPRPRWRERAVIAAVTIAHVVFYIGGFRALADVPMQLRIHEAWHVRQARRYGLLRFWWLYIKELWRNGYRNNAFEVEARRNAGQE